MWEFNDLNRSIYIKYVQSFHSYPSSGECVYVIVAAEDNPKLSVPCELGFVQTHAFVCVKNDKIVPRKCSKQCQNRFQTASVFSQKANRFEVVNFY